MKTVDRIDPIATMEQLFSIQLKHKGHGEYAGACPWCGGEDRLLVWDTGNYMCRPGDGHCGRKGFVDELTTNHRLTELERRTLALEAAQRRAERERAEITRRLTALEQMAHCHDHLVYYDQMTRCQREYWYGEGINDASINEYKLGYCAECPTDGLHRPSWTIPIHTSTGVLCNIRHRLVGEDRDKYRPHMAGLGTHLFNSRFVKSESELLLVEGEKKAIVVSQEFAPTIGVMGAGNFQMDWLRHFGDVRRLYVALDPDVRGKAWQLGRTIKAKAGHLDVRVVTLPTKPDDMFILGCTRRQFAGFLDWARQI